MSGNPTPLRLEQPLQVDEARQACQLIARQRQGAREQMERANTTLAEKERLYRKARAVAYVENTGAPSAGMRDALVDDATADARYDRDVARGVVEAQQELLKEIDGTRASLHRLIDWSARTQVDHETHEFQSVNPRRVA
jgi:hypothetical protein